MKELIDIGTYQYSLDEAGYNEAVQDANSAALELHKAFNRHTGTRYVVKDSRGYYGPINEHKKNRHFNNCEVAYVADPAKLAEVK